MSALDDFRPIAHNIARKAARSAPAHLMDADDLEQEVMRGAYEAAATHDPELGALRPRLITRGRAAMIDAARKLDPVTHTDRRMLRKVEAATNELTQLLKRAPTEAEIAFTVGLKPELLRSLRQREAVKGHTHHLEERVAGDGQDALTLGETLASSSGDPLDELLRRAEAERLERWLERLTPIEREVALLIHVDGLEPHEAAERLNLGGMETLAIDQRAREKLE